LTNNQNNFYINNKNIIYNINFGGEGKEKIGNKTMPLKHRNEPTKNKKKPNRKAYLYQLYKQIRYSKKPIDAKKKKV